MKIACGFNTFILNTCFFNNKKCEIWSLELHGLMGVACTIIKNHFQAIVGMDLIASLENLNICTDCRKMK